MISASAMSDCSSATAWYSVENLVEFGEALVVHDDGEKVPHLREHADASCDRVENLQLLLVRDRGIHQDFAQFMAAGEGSAEVVELLLGRVGIEMRRGRRPRQRHGRSAGRGQTLVLPFLRVVARQPPGEALHQQTIGLGRDDQLARGLIDRELGGVLLDLPLREGGRGGDLLLGGGEDLLLLFFDAGLDALLVGRRVLLGLRAHRGDLAVQLAQTLFDAAQTRACLFSRRARIDEVLLNRGVAVAEGLRAAS